MHPIQARKVGESPWGSLSGSIAVGNPVRLQEEYYVLGTPDGWFSVAVQLSGRAIDGLRGQVFGDEVASFVAYVARGRPLFLP